VKPNPKWNLWLRWVAANAVGEMVGLGLTFTAGIGLFLGIEPQNLIQVFLFAGLATATGVIEGFVIGLAQWLVLRRVKPGITRRAWITATLAGALMAWFLGSLPSSLAGQQAQTTSTGNAGLEEPAFALLLVMAAGMGLALGLVLAFPQWLVLRKHTQRAIWWLPANSVAWAAGMPIVFAAVGWAYDAGSLWKGVLVMAVSLWATGVVVGAIHGIALVWLCIPKSGSQAVPA
jgi:hypothetical protein